MRLNDPFNRVSRNRQRDYDQFRQRLLEAGIADHASLDRFMRNARSTLLKLAALIVAVALLAGLLLPGMQALWAAVAGLALMWLLAGYLVTRTHGARFRREQC